MTSLQCLGWSAGDGHVSTDEESGWGWRGLAARRHDLGWLVESNQ
jgi:hypothetical protein